jgi:lysophospholipase L1-like esterase
MLVMFGTNDVNTSSRSQFEKNLKRLLDIAIANNVVPVLVTKADNLEGDGSINAIIARVAYEYEIPLLNLWRAMHEIPDSGLQQDQVHLTYAQPFFDSPENMQKGWPVRNLTALQMLAFLDEQLAP